MKILGLDDLDTLLESRDKAEPVNIITRTVQGKSTMNSGRKDKDTGEYPNQFFNKIYHLASRNVFIGASYEKCVNRQRERECQPLMIDGSLEYFHEEEIWKGKGEMLNRYVIRHTGHGELYLIYKPKMNDIGNVVNVESGYYWVANDKKLTPAEYAATKKWFKPKSESQRQEVDKIVQWRTLTLCNLLQMTINKVTYGVEIESQAVVEEE